jgi:hypothetical protein
LTMGGNNAMWALCPRHVNNASPTRYGVGHHGLTIWHLGALIRTNKPSASISYTHYRIRQHRHIADPSLEQRSE